MGPSKVHVAVVVGVGGVGAALGGDEGRARVPPGTKRKVHVGAVAVLVRVVGVGKGQVGDSLPLFGGEAVLGSAVLGDLPGVDVEAHDSDAAQPGRGG